MILFFLVALFLGVSEVVYAQKTCTKIHDQLQNCIVTVEITGDAPQYLLQRVDGGAPAVERTITAKVVTDTFNDAGNIVHAYSAVGIYDDGRLSQSNTEVWVTPKIPAPSQVTNYINITTDRMLTLTRCKTDGCAPKLQLPKSTRLTINGVPK